MSVCVARGNERLPQPAGRDARGLHSLVPGCCGPCPQPQLLPSVPSHQAVHRGTHRYVFCLLLFIVVTVCCWMLSNSLHQHHFFWFHCWLMFFLCNSLNVVFFSFLATDRYRDWTGKEPFQDTEAFFALKVFEKKKTSTFRQLQPFVTCFLSSFFRCLLCSFFWLVCWACSPSALLTSP